MQLALKPRRHPDQVTSTRDEWKAVTTAWTVVVAMFLIVLLIATMGAGYHRHLTPEQQMQLFEAPQPE
jgi:hypothetical protein